MNNKIKVTAVSYLNAKPLLYGFDNPTLNEWMDLDVTYPSDIAVRLKNNTTDLGLVSVAALLTNPDLKIISDYGIAADGPVASVCIFSNQPLSACKKIYLDYQSRTSVKLAEILIKKYWNYDIEFLEAPTNFMDLIDGTTAGVIIGDRALQSWNCYKYGYDLAAEWIEFTGLDFVFAGWLSNKDLPASFIEKFNEANAVGLQKIDEVIATLPPFESYDLKKYYTENIKYVLDDKKKEGLKLFLELARNL